MRSDLLALPKVELHVHLEGTISAETASTLARRRGEVPQEVLPLVDGSYPIRFESFAAFVHLYQAVSRQVRDPDDLTTVAAAFAEGQAAQNVIYTEVTFTALTHVRNGMEEKAMWAALRDGFSAAPEVRIVLIVDAIRDLGVDHARATIRLVDGADAPIVALGLTGSENSVPEREFVMLRAAADELGLGLAVHAGETGSAANVRSAIDDLGADRIGHGVATIQDPGLLRRVVRDGIPLEVCPSSNVTLGVYPSLEAHPFPRLWEAGANVTVNSDDPPFFGTTLTDELEIAVRLLGRPAGGELELQLRAARAAFLPEVEKQRLIERLEEGSHPSKEGPTRV